MTWKCRGCLLAVALLVMACRGSGPDGDGAEEPRIDLGARQADGDLDQNREGTGSGRGLSQSALQALAHSLRWKVAVIENGVTQCPQGLPAGGCHDAELRLENAGALFTDRGWSLYFSSIRRILASKSEEFTISHVQGDLHRLEPTSRFAGFRAHEVKEVPYQAAYVMVAEREAMPRCYLAAPGMDPHAAIDVLGRRADWERFANTLGYKELLKLDLAAIRYRVEVPGARVTEGKLAVTTALPGIAIEYRRAPDGWTRFDPAKPPSVDPAAVGALEIRGLTPMGRPGRANPISP